MLFVLTVPCSGGRSCDRLREQFRSHDLKQLHLTEAAHQDVSCCDDVTVTGQSTALTVEVIAASSAEVIHTSLLTALWTDTTGVPSRHSRERYVGCEHGLSESREVMIMDSQVTCFETMVRAVLGGFEAEI